MLRGQLREEGSASLKVKDRNPGLPRSIRPEVSACGKETIPTRTEGPVPLTTVCSARLVNELAQESM